MFQIALCTLKSCDCPRPSRRLAGSAGHDKRNPNVVLLVFAMGCGAVYGAFKDIFDYFPHNYLDNEIRNGKFERLLQIRGQD